MLFDITSDERGIFQIIGQCADDLGYPAYVVGGYVRDRLLGLRSKDIDIVAVGSGSGIKVAENVASQLRPIPQVVVYRRFGTALIKHLDMQIEFVGARKESIEVAGIIDASPAAKAGFHVGDQITAIDGSPVETMKIDEIRELLEGASGSTLTMTVRRGSEESNKKLVRRELI